jgi:hypothetical protein
MTQPREYLTGPSGRLGGTAESLCGYEGAGR